MDLTITFTFCALGGYLLGSIPFGLVITRLAGLGDIRKIGSGNIGATNVLRTGHWGLALLTVVCDASKAGVAALIASFLVPAEDMFFCGFLTTASVFAGLIAGTAAIVGHNFPVWLKFKGGKGVASAFGFFLATSPVVAGMALLTWLVMAFTTRYSSLSAITAAVMVPFFAFFLSSPVNAVFYSLIGLLVLFRHRGNIVRLLKGEESKISFKKKK